MKAGVQAIVYSKRELSSDETNQLILTINEGSQSDLENQKLDLLLSNFINIQLEILGVMGV